MGRRKERTGILAYLFYGDIGLLKRTVVSVVSSSCLKQKNLQILSQHVLESKSGAYKLSAYAWGTGVVLLEKGLTQMTKLSLLFQSVENEDPESARLPFILLCDAWNSFQRSNISAPCRTHSSLRCCEMR